MSGSAHPLKLFTSPGVRLRHAGADMAESIDRYFQTSLFLLIVTGFVTLASTGRLDFLSTLFVSAALIARGYLLLKGRTVQIPERWTTYFTLLYVLVFVADLFLVSGSYVTASVHLVLFSMVVKIFSVQRDRDHLYLAILSLLAVLAASVLTVDSVFFAAFCIFVLLAVSTFVSMEMRRSVAKSTNFGLTPAQPKARRRLNLSLSSTALVLVIAIVVGSTVLFFLLPRFSAGYLSTYAPKGDVISGFSQNVNLGEIGRIQQSDQVIMHVQVDHAAGLDLKWRGLALSHFDGHKWSNEVDTNETIDWASGHYMLRGEQRRTHNLPETQLDAGQFRLVHYRVVMEPIGTSMLFLPPVPVELTGRFRSIAFDEGGSISNMDRAHMTESYEGISQVNLPSATTLRSSSGKYPPEIVIKYLDRPSVDSRIPALVAQITAGARTDFDKAVAIQNYLKQNFTYTLNLPVRTPADPIGDFLFERKQGHCEYFASTMTVMLRLVGIPARIVNGFQSGEYNDVTGSYIVRARDAHSWVEAYMPSIGWYTFDPTPASLHPATGKAWNRMLLYMDAMREFWREWVINYDFSHQRSLTTTATTTAARKAFDFRRWWNQKYRMLIMRAERVNRRVSHSPWKYALAALAAFALAVALWNLRNLAGAYHRYRIARSPASEPQLAASIWYTRLTRWLARRGYERAPTQTASEFLRTIPEEPLRASVESFTRHYERARFGLSAEDAGKLPALYEEISSR